MLQVNFCNDELVKLYSIPDYRKGYYPPAVINKYIQLVNLIQNIDTLLEINTFGGYKISQKKGNMKGIRTARLSDLWRLEFTVDNQGNIQIINLQQISCHYND